jgi:hypothetical protein
MEFQLIGKTEFHFGNGIADCGLGVASYSP